MPTRKSISPRPPLSAYDTTERRFSAFAPDSFDVLNPSISRSPKPGADRGDEPERPGSSMEYNDKGQIVTFSGRVIDASDHLPIDSWAPEPERKADQKERPQRERLNGSRDLDAALEREAKYRRDRMERERIRNAASTTFGSTDSPSNALVSTRHHYSSNNSPVNAGAMVLASNRNAYGSGDRGIQKRNNRQDYSVAVSPSSHVLRERENVGGYGSSPTYGAGSRQSYAAPPIPAKIPLESEYEYQSEDMHALSLELQSIDIGPGSGGRSRGTRVRRYG